MAKEWPQNPDESEFDDLDREEKRKKAGADEFAALLDSSMKSSSKKLSVGDRIRGEILVLGREECFVSTGTMNDGSVSRRDLLDADGNMPYKVGDMIDLFVTFVKGTEVRLSPKPTAKNMAEDVREAYEQRMTVEGKVVEVVKGGVRVSIKGKLAFCPISQLDTARVETGEEYVGRKLDFVITKFEEGGRNIVVSRRKLLEQEAGASESGFLSQHQIGDVIRGKVKRLEDFGAFIEVAPGVEGMAHISELAWSRVAHPSEVLQVGQDVSVKITKIETVETPRGPKNRIGLSIKQAGGEPWENLPGHIQAGSVVEGKVTRLAKFGAFVQLAPGVEGLVPLSEMSYTKRVLRAEEIVKEGETVSVMIKELSPETHRIGLSIKDAGSDPWALAGQKFPVNTIVKGKVTRREAYGLFIQLDEGVVGLLPKSKAMENPEFPFEKLKVNDEATVQVAELRLGERRISLQVPKDPDADEWRKYSPQEGVSSGGGGGFGGAFGDALKKALDKKGAGKK